MSAAAINSDGKAVVVTASKNLSHRMLMTVLMANGGL